LVTDSSEDAFIQIQTKMEELKELKEEKELNKDVR
jgi:hypothetical protein